MPWTLRLEDKDGVRKIGLSSSSDRCQLAKTSLSRHLIEASPHYDTLLDPVQVKALIAENEFSCHRPELAAY